MSPPKSSSPRQSLPVQALPSEAPTTPGRIAAIDVGSNSIHMVIADPDAAGGFRVVDREKEMVRLGRSALSKHRRLSKKAVRDGLEALARMTTLARLRGVTRTAAVATSAVREAENGQDFLDQVRARSGLEVRLLSGEDEGRLIYRAVREAVDLGQGHTVVADIGGGSTEWIHTVGGALEAVVSLRLGSLRCAADLKGSPPSAKSVRKLNKAIAQRLDALPAPPACDLMVATSGTAACCADLADHFAGRNPPTTPSGLRELRIKDLDRVIERLAVIPQEKIVLLPPVAPQRSGSIFPGALILRRVAALAKVDRIQVSDRALREGIVLDLVGRSLDELPEPGQIRAEQIDSFSQRAPAIYEHHRTTARLAARLFDLTVSVHGLGPREREWLEYAAMLHDIGYLVGYRRHHKHSYYLITSAPLDAFDPREIAVIAHVARYHRRATPSKKHPTFAALKGWQQTSVRKLAPLLRIADALDRSHAQRVENLYCSIRKKKVVMEVISSLDIDLELRSTRERARLFNKVFGCKVKVRQGLEPVD
ncbi:MAG: Ppx/GppA phosphatase family protein [Acidobacteriota bacterium]